MTQPTYLNISIIYTHIPPPTSHSRTWPYSSILFSLLFLFLPVALLFWITCMPSPYNPSRTGVSGTPLLYVIGYHDVHFFRGYKLFFLFLLKMQVFWGLLSFFPLYIHFASHTYADIPRFLLRSNNSSGSNLFYYTKKNFFFIILVACTIHTYVDLLSSFFLFFLCWSFTWNISAQSCPTPIHPLLPPLCNFQPLYNTKRFVYPRNIGTT